MSDCDPVGAGDRGNGEAPMFTSLSRAPHRRGLPLRRGSVPGTGRRLVGAGLVLALAGTVPALAAPSAATAAEAVCPGVHDATDCGVLITIAADGSVSLTSPAGTGNPYDGNDDTLVGVVNESAAALDS